MEESLALDRRSMEFAASVIGDVTDADLDNPTPCGDWTLRELIGHVIATNDAFAASFDNAIAGRPAPRGEMWDRVDYRGPAAARFAESAARFDAAFPGTPERVMIWPYGPVPREKVLWMHTVDMVVHGWDVARSLGRDGDPGDELASAAYRMMLSFKDAPRPNPAFGVIVPVPDDATDLDKLLGYCGRTP